MKGKWYRGLNIVSAILIGYGGIGISTVQPKTPKYYGCIISLIIGIIVFAFLLIKKSYERPEEDTNK